MLAVAATMSKFLQRRRMPIAFVGLLAFAHVSLPLLHWKRPELLGLQPAEMERLFGLSTCKKMDEGTWFWGLSSGTRNLVGYSLQVRWDANAVGRSIVSDARTRPEFFGLFSGCGRWTM